MPKRIPISIAKAVAVNTGCQQVIILAWDGELTHVVTYGKTVEDCAQAAESGNRIKTFMGWPENTMSQPSRVKKLEVENKLLREQLSNLGWMLENARNA